MESIDEIGSSEVKLNTKGVKEGVNNEKNDEKSCGNSKENRKIVYEKPKGRKEEEEQIEEFDTDEEEDEDNSLGGKKISEQIPGPDDYSKHLTYEGETCIYTEPETGKKLVWDAKQNAWREREESIESSKESVPMEDLTKNYEYDGKNYVYTDKNTNLTYKFDQEKNEWIVKEEKDKSEENKSDQVVNDNPPHPTTSTQNPIYGFENDTHTYTDPNDGSVYMWDREKNAWFPKVDDDFMARYQMSYGFNNQNAEEPIVKPTVSVAQTKADKEQKRLDAKRKTQEPATWFEVDEQHNTSIYVHGLPLDITMDEVKELFTKCGLIARDEKGKDKIKLYRDSYNEIKGDALCTYIKVESVNLALNILDGWKIRGKTLSVQRAKFQLKGEYDPSKKPKKKKKDKERQKKFQEKLFDWRPDQLPGQPQKCERVVIIKNLFKPEDFDHEVSLLLEYQQDIRSECQKCGNVTKVVVYDRHPEGVAQVTFKEPEEAQECVQLLNGRWFGQRKITAEIWDGKTKYKVVETEAEIEARIEKWDKYLEDQDEKVEGKKTEDLEKKMETSLNEEKSETSTNKETKNSATKEENL